MSCALALVTPGRIDSQTKITVDKNKYTPAQDVQVGQEAAAQVRKELPLLKDELVDEWVDTVGARLVTAIPPEFAHKEFRYTFEVVNQKEINAFALPGGPMFLNRGMIEAAKTEAEVAGVMAHEISHVALRHGTAQATKAREVPDRRHSRADCGRGRRRHRSAASSARAARSVSAPIS